MLENEIKMAEKGAEIIDISEIRKETTMVEEKEAEIIDIADIKKDTVEKTTQKVADQISPESTKKLLGMAETIDSMLRTVGSLEAQKMKILMQSENMRENLEKEARKALLDAGVPEGNVEGYRVDIRTGKITKQDIGENFKGK